MDEDEEIKEGHNLSDEKFDQDESDQSFDEDDSENPNVSLLIHNYLQSEYGHEIAKQVLDLIKDIKQSTLGRNVEQDKVNAEQTKLRMELTHKHYGRLLVSQGIVFALTILAASLLTYIGKFEPPVAILFGTLVGYFFGKRTSSKDD